MGLCKLPNRSGGKILKTEIITTSRTWTAPVTGDYNVRIFGGGAGGGSSDWGGNGGGSGSRESESMFFFFSF